MEHKIVTLEDFKVIGMEYVGNNANAEIAAMWEVFNEREKEIDTPYNAVCYGLCYDMDFSGAFSYMAGVKVESIDQLPNGMKVKAVPGGKFAVFTFTGHISKISEFWGAIYSEQLPQLGLQPEDGITFELYDERYCQNGACDIYIRVK